METQHFIKTLHKQKIKTFFLSTLIALNVKWIPRFKDTIMAYHLRLFYLHHVALDYDFE